MPNSIWNYYIHYGELNRTSTLFAIRFYYSLTLRRKHAAKTEFRRLEDLRKLGAIEEKMTGLDSVGAGVKKIGGITELILRYLINRQFGPGDHSEEARALQGELARTLLDIGADASGGLRPEGIQLSPNERQSAESAFLTSLQYADMVDRESRISHAHESTFQWVLTDQNADADLRDIGWTNVRSWLESTSQLYWITGKAGSGKSTLMKYLCSPQLMSGSSGDEMGKGELRCLPFLQAWANPLKAIIVSFYFWNSGAQIQMTQEGLLRTLLYQLLKQRPEILPSLAPAQWELICLFNRPQANWKAQELQAMLLRAVQMLHQTTKICFFIDGLDEFDSNYEVLIDTVEKLILCGDNVKALVASRPWNIFQNAFGQEANLRLEDLTYDDIKNFVHDRFNADEGFESLRKRKPDFAEQLMENIVVKASGVFLWVDLVVSSLLAGMRLGDRIEDFQKRLDELPPDLERLYDKILHSLDSFYLDHAAQYFSLIETAKTPLTVLQFAFADEESVESAISMECGPLSQDDISQRIDGVNKRLNSRCKGLLEVERGLRRNIWQIPSQLTVQYLHRTVRDFVKSPKSQAFLASKRDPHFDPGLKLCIAYLMNLKSWTGIVEENLLLDHEEPPPDVLTVINCVRGAGGALETNASGVLRLLDDLDQVITRPNYKQLLSADYHKVVKSENKSIYTPGGQIPLFIRLPQSDDSHLFESMTGPDPESPLLTLACVHGVLVYVKARAQWGGFVARHMPGGFERWPLMVDALSNDAVEPRMVECLLDLGTDPNFKVGGIESQTLWMIALKKATIQHSLSSLAAPGQFSQAEKNWKEVVQLMFARGAVITRAQDLLLTPGARLILKDIQVKSPSKEKATMFSSLWSMFFQ